jgi:hypothetical protein
MIVNCFEPAWQHRGKTVYKWGKDSTGLIEYQFNNQGFRSNFDYTIAPDYAFFGNSSVFGIGVPVDKNLTSFFTNSHNYGLSGNYMNYHSVENLRRFCKSFAFTTSKIIFFWIDRPEPIENMIHEVNLLIPNVLHISSGTKLAGAINLMPHRDNDVSGTHPGIQTHKMWAKTIKLLLNRA